MKLSTVQRSSPAMIGAAACVAALAAMLIILIGGWQILRTRDALLLAAERDAQNLTRSLAQHAARTIDGVDIMLSGVVERVQSNAMTGLGAYLSRRKSSLDQLRRIAVTDDAGQWIADSMSPHEPRSSGTLPEFAWHRDHPTSDLHLETMRRSRYDGALVIPVSRRWNNPDGSFAGIVSAGLTPDYFAAFYATVKIGTMGTVALWSDDGHLLIRYPQPPEQVSAPLKMMTAIFATRSGVVRARSPHDGIERIFTFEHIDTYPLIVSASIAIDEALSSWRRDAWTEGGVMGIAVLALLFLGIGLERHRRRLLVAMQQMTQQSTLLQATFDNMDQALLKISPEGLVEIFNQRFITLFLIPPAILNQEKITYYDIIEFLIAAGEYSKTDPAFQAHVSQRNAPLILGTYERSRPDGTILEVRTVALPDGAIVRTYADVTARHKAELARREIEARYRLLADNSTDLIALKSTFTGPRPYVSPSVLAMTGYTPEEFIDLPVADYIHPDDQAQVAAEFATLTPDHLEVRSLHRVWHKAGQLLWVETDFRLIEAGAPDRTVLVRSRDVTVRHQAELALATSEARYRVLAETTTDLITQLDLSMQRQYVSPACRHLLGFEPEEMLGRQPSADIHPDDAPDVRALAARLVAGDVEGGRAVTTYRTRHKAGHWLWVEAGLNLIRDEATGAPVSLICSLRDVTERQRVARHLERAKAEAEAAARAKAEFVANMSHELRTPLTGIIGVHDILRADPGLTAAQRRLIDLAGEAGHSLLAIVNDVLDFSKADAGQLAIEQVPFDIDDLVASCCELARGQMHGSDVVLSMERTPRPLGWFAGDPTRVRQILLNLLTNAVKFTERGSITVEVAYADETGLLRVAVADTGIGIPPDRVGALFERFTQADTSTTRRYGGTGLGLAICKLLIDLMGGCIGAEARAGGGSIFWFELRLSRSEGRDAPRADAIPNRTITAGWRLLLAEDNAVNAEIVTAMLAGRGYRVSVVADGAAAVMAARAQSAPIDLILMDLQMPVMDGLAATAAIRAHEARVGGRVPIVGLTANALAEDAELCLSVGMDAHVAKPIDWTRLFAVLDELLRPDARPMAAERPSGTDPRDVLDLAKLEELAVLIGRDRLGGMVAHFIDDLRVRMVAILHGDEAELSWAVHALVSSAGQLGFCELSALCAEADVRLRSGAGFDRTEELRLAAARAEAAAACSGFIIMA